jgi:hypothetical protein
MYYPITHIKYLNQIIKFMRVPEYWVGCKRYGLLYFKIDQVGIELEVSSSSGLYSGNYFELWSDDFLIISVKRWPNFDSAYNKSWIYNESRILLQREEQYPNGVDQRVEYIGDLDEIVSVATLLQLME